MHFTVPMILNKSINKRSDRNRQQTNDTSTMFQQQKLSIGDNANTHGAGKRHNYLYTTSKK